jgi:hypothetical protein
VPVEKTQNQNPVSWGMLIVAYSMWVVAWLRYYLGRVLTGMSPVPKKPPSD